MDQPRHNSYCLVTRHPPLDPPKRGFWGGLGGCLAEGSKWGVRRTRACEHPCVAGQGAVVYGGIEGLDDRKSVRC